MLLWCIPGVRLYHEYVFGTRVFDLFGFDAIQPEVNKTIMDAINQLRSCPSLTHTVQ